MKKIHILGVLYFGLVSWNSVYSRDALSYYEEAYRVEKISPILSIPLYEKVLSIKPDRQVLKTSVSRLRFLYLKFGKSEEAILLRQKYGNEFAGNKKIETLVQRMSDDMGVSSSFLSNVIYLSVQRGENSINRLTQILGAEQNKKLFRFIFSLKMNLKDYNTLQKIFESYPASDPFLKAAFLVKSGAEEADAELDMLGAGEPLSLNRKSDLLYLKGMTFRNKKQMKLSARYFLMSSSYARKDRGLAEAAKTLIASGKKSEGCGLLTSPIKVENESDEILSMYCTEKSLKNLRPVLPAIKILLEKDDNPFLKRIANEMH